MTKKLEREQLVKLHELLQKREPRYRYKRGPHGIVGTFLGVPNGWNKILVATGEIVATRCYGCEKACANYFPIPEGLASDV